MASKMKAKKGGRSPAWLSQEALDAMEDIRVYMRDEFCQKVDAEPLHPDLEEYREAGDFPSIRHPLYYAVPYFSQTNGLYNRQYRLRQLMIRDLLAAGKPESVLSHVERPYRVIKLLELRDQMSEQQFWKSLRWVWTDSENLWQSVELLHDVLRGNTGRPQMMDKNERAFLKSLGNSFRIYRGHAALNRCGWSWTLSAPKACWFARRYANRKDDFASYLTESVAMGIVSREDVLAYMSGRGEYEIVVDPQKIDYLSKWINFKLPPSLMTLGQAAIDRFKLSAGKSDHGPAHWLNVLRIGRSLSDLVAGDVDKLVVDLFALLHDCCRENEMLDPEHGRRAAREAPAMLDRAKIKLTMTQLGKLQAAIAGHADGRVSDDPTIGTCWDADRLDLRRVGIVPRPGLMSTNPAKGSVAF